MYFINFLKNTRILAKKYKRFCWILLFSLVFSLYGLLIWQNFISFLNTIPEHFGYLDLQDNWRALNDFVKLKVPYKDYFYEYGWFLLLLQSIPYLIFQQSYLGVIIARHLFLPIIGVLLAYIIGRNVLKKTHLILIFLFFNLFYGATMDFSPVRHLVAELSLSFFIIYLLKQKKVYLILSGVISGFSLLTAAEYGIALNLTILGVFLLTLILKTEIKKKDFLFFFILGFAVVSPFLVYLNLKNAFATYLQFTTSIMNNFYFSSPCNADSFPRFSDIQTLNAKSSWLIKAVPIEFLQNLNMYTVIIFYLLTVLVLIFRALRWKKLAKKDIIVGSLVLYGLFAYIRTLDTPCIGYLRYGMIPFFLLLTICIGDLAGLIQNSKSFIKKIIALFLVCIFFIWFTLTDNTGIVHAIINKSNNFIKPILHPVLKVKLNKKIGWSIDKEQVEKYEEIARFIQNNTMKDDTQLVYPWGPYNNLAELQSANSLQIPLAFIAGDEFVKRIISDLENKKPKFVVISLKNAGGVAHYGKKREDLGLSGRYYSLGFEDGPVFSGRGNKIETYILERYVTVIHNDVAIVMKKRERQVVLDEPFQKVGEIKRFATPIKASDFEIKFKKPIKATDIEIKFKLDGDVLTKRLSRYFVNFYVKKVGAVYGLPVASPLARKEWQKEWISMIQIENIEAIKIELGQSRGIAWWMHPHSFQIESINFYNWKQYTTRK